MSAYLDYDVMELVGKKYNNILLEHNRQKDVNKNMYDKVISVIRGVAIEAELGRGHSREDVFDRRGPHDCSFIPDFINRIEDTDSCYIEPGTLDFTQKWTRGWARNYWVCWGFPPLSREEIQRYNVIREEIYYASPKR